MSDNRIEALTEEQLARLPEFKEKWIKIGLNQEPINYELCKKIISKQYTDNGLKVPEFKYSRSPRESREILDLDGDWNINEDTGDKKYNLLDIAAFGFHDSSWLCFYDVFKEFFDLECVKPLNNLLELSKVCGWWYPMDTLCVIEERPILRTEEMEDGSGVVQGHSEDQLAIEYPDGWGVAIVHGKRIKNSKWITNPETITMKDIESTSDQDLISILIERYGWDRYLKEIGATPIDGRHNLIENTFEALYDTKIGRRLMVTCPTARMFSKPVTSEVKTCEEAQKWLGGEHDEEIKINIIGRT